MPQCIPVHIHDWKVQEYFDGLGLRCGFDHVPIKIESVWVQQAEASFISIIADLREYAVDKHSIAVAREKINPI